MDPMTAQMGMIPKFDPLGFPVMADILTPIEIGNVRVDTFVVDEQEAFVTFMKCQFSGEGRTYVAPGRYARMLVRTDQDMAPDEFGETEAKWRIMMSDTMAERVETQKALKNLTGNVLVAGLGLGMLVHALVLKPDVKSVTVIEVNPFVISAVAPTLPKNVTVIHKSVFDWQPDPGVVYDTWFYDIWPTIGEHMLTQMKQLRFLHQDGHSKATWVEGWLERELEAVQAIEDSILEYAKHHGVDPVKVVGMVNSRIRLALENEEVKRMREQG